MRRPSLHRHKLASGPYGGWHFYWGRLHVWWVRTHYAGHPRDIGINWRRTA